MNETERDQQRQEDLAKTYAYFERNLKTAMFKTIGIWSKAQGVEVAEIQNKNGVLVVSMSNNSCYASICFLPERKLIVLTMCNFMYTSKQKVLKYPVPPIIYAQI